MKLMLSLSMVCLCFNSLAMQQRDIDQCKTGILQQWELHPRAQFAATKLIKLAQDTGTEVGRGAWKLLKEYTEMPLAPAERTWVMQEATEGQLEDIVAWRAQIFTFLGESEGDGLSTLLQRARSVKQVVGGESARQAHSLAFAERAEQMGNKRKRRLAGFTPYEVTFWFWWFRFY